ncbi:MAG: hypothetical protein JWO83_4899 [Caulobacteraceae bacterium]|nr:hypothetical protein [Caulobacteraceae bacterium]
MLLTSAQSAMHKPAFIDPAGDPRLSALSVSPPFLFRNVTARIFSLEANVAVLTAFCDQYLNMDIPPTIAHYAPALPYVYLMVLNYGSMAPSSVQAQNVGWVAQHEVAFTVVLQRWREENGELVFKDWATVSPFIYVDDQLSLNTGREVYGWNKVTGTIESDIPLWVTDPAAKVRQFQLGLVDFASAYSGANQSKEILLQIDLDPPTTFTTFPPDPRNPWSPLWAVPNAVANATSLLGGVLDTALAMRIRGFEQHRSWDGLWAMGAKAREKLKSVFPDMLPSRGQAPNATALHNAVAGLPTLFFDNVTLKQFRNPENPDLACYQALVKSKMGVDRVNRAGLLGDVNLLRGDTSGGYSIRIHQYDSQPIIQTLGLEVESWNRADRDAAVATLKPILPYWVDVDLYYGKGELICSRAHGAATEVAGYWQDEQKDAVPEVPPPPENCSPPYYNTALGAATQPIVGPFHFPDVTLQVFPLLADADKLQQLLKNYLNDPLARKGMIGVDGMSRRGWRFEPLGAYVYMMVTVYGDQLGSMWSGANNIGGFFDREVTFTVPVKWYDENDQLITVGMIEPFTYSNNSRAVATDREVNGYNSIRATIESPKDRWLTTDGPVAKRQFLRLETEVIPALNVGQKAEKRTLLEIDERHGLPTNDTEWRAIADTWGRAAIEDLKRKYYDASADRGVVDDVKALALEILANGAPVNRIIVKQYRDGEELASACYQAIVKATSAITAIYDIREIDVPVHVRVYRQPGHPLVDSLGLTVKHQQSFGGNVVDVLQPLRPFWMRVGMTEDLATVACYRAQDTPWQIVHPEFDDAKAVAAATGDETPYFRRKGSTRVGGWLARVPPRQISARPTGAEREALLNQGKLDGWLEGRLTQQVEGADLHLNVRNESARWLRRSLSNQLTWSRLGFEGLRDPTLKAALRDAFDAPTADPGVAALFECELAPSSLYRFCEARSAVELIRIRCRLDELALPWDMTLPHDLGPEDPDKELLGDVKYSDGTSFSDSDFLKKLQLVAPVVGGLLNQTTRGLDSAMLTWSWKGLLDSTITSNSLLTSLLKLEVFPSDRALAMSLMFPPQGLVMLADLAAYAPVVNDQISRLQSKSVAAEPATPPKSDDEVMPVTAERAVDTSAVDFAALNTAVDKFKEMDRLADLLEVCILDWMAPSRWLPISYDRARKSIAALPDLQLVIDNILSSEWENHSPMTRWDNPKGGRKPDECLLDTPDIAMVGPEQGLVRWIDPESEQAGDLWIVAEAALAAADSS